MEQNRILTQALGSIVLCTMKTGAAQGKLGVSGVESTGVRE
jgi:hypothetical protein